MSIESKAAIPEKSPSDERATKLYRVIIDQVEKQLEGWGYRMRDYDRSRLMVFCREVLPQYDEEMRRLMSGEGSGESVFSSGQEVKARFYAWLMDYADDGLSAKMRRFNEQEAELSRQAIKFAHPKLLGDKEKETQ